MHLDEAIFNEHAEVCKVLANPKRLKILYLLSKGPANVGHIAEEAGISMTNASQHLARLRAKGLVEAHKEGSAVIYSINDARIPRACNLIRESLMDRLRAQASLVTRAEGAGVMMDIGQGGGKG